RAWQIANNRSPECSVSPDMRHAIFACGQNGRSGGLARDHPCYDDLLTRAVGRGVPTARPATFLIQRQSVSSLPVPIAGSVRPGGAGYSLIPDSVPVRGREFRKFPLFPTPQPIQSVALRAAGFLFRVHGPVA